MIQKKGGKVRKNQKNLTRLPQKTKNQRRENQKVLMTKKNMQKKRERKRKTNKFKTNNGVRPQYLKNK